MPSVVSEARALWKRCVRKWTQQAQEFAEVVRSIEDDDLRFVVTSMVKALSNGQGAFNVEPLKTTESQVTNIDLDEDYLDALEEQLRSRGIEDPEDLMNQAGVWLLQSLRTKHSVGFLGWAFGHVIFSDGDARKVSISDGGVVYSGKEGCITGIMVQINGRRKLIPMRRILDR